MKKISASLKYGLVAALATLTLAACGNGASDSEADNTIKIGSMEGIQAEILDVAVQKLEAEDYKVEVTTFSDYNTPNNALTDGSLDANIYQHTPFLEQYNTDHGTDLKSAGAAFLNPMAIYSETYQSIDDAENGATFALPNDPSNMGRALLLLANAGLITFEEGVTNPTTSDIIDNPKQLEFIELDPAQIPGKLTEVEFAAINSNYAVDFGLDPRNDSIYIEGADSPYVVQIVTPAEDVDSEKIQALVNAYQSDEVKAAMDDLSNGTLLPGWEN